MVVLVERYCSSRYSLIGGHLVCCSIDSLTHPTRPSSLLSDRDKNISTQRITAQLRALLPPFPVDRGTLGAHPYKSKPSNMSFV